MLLDISGSLTLLPLLHSPPIQEGGQVEVVLDEQSVEKAIKMAMDVEEHDARK